METWKPENPDEEPAVNLSFGHGEFLATRETARLYTHLGRLAMFDHVFCFSQEAGSGFYIFNFVNGYDTLKEYMLDNNYPAYLNQTEVSNTDVEAYERAVLRDIDSTPDWLPEL